MSPQRVLLTGAVAGAAAAVLVPLDRPGLGWPLLALVVFCLVKRVRPGWATLSLLLFGTGAVNASTELFPVCVLAGCAAGSLAVVGGRTARGLAFGSAAAVVGAGRAMPWLAAELRHSGVRRLSRPVLLTGLVLVVFVPLLAGADAAFAELIGSMAPDDSFGPSLFLFALVGLGTVGCLFQLHHPSAGLDGAPTLRRTLARRDWAFPVGTLVLVFAVFVGVQIRVLFGGDDYVQRTANLTYAEYARQGFWQLLLVTLLALGIVAAIARLAPVETGADRNALRALLGALSVLTLVIVASALARMWSYQQAYGFTVLRIVVAACELWLGVVFLLVIAAGVKLDGRWLTRAVVGSGFAALVVLGLVDPDRLTAEGNVARWRETGRIDVAYLARLSDDAVPAIASLPADVRRCVLQARTIRPDDWRSWNLARSQAREAVSALPPQGCAR